MSCSSPYGNHVTGAVEVTEAALVRDILYVFQGIDGRNVKMSSTDNCYKVEGKVRAWTRRLPSQGGCPRGRAGAAGLPVLLRDAGGLQAGVLAPVPARPACAPPPSCDAGARAT